MLNLQNETIKQFYKSPFVKTSGDTTSPMLLASCGPPLRPRRRREVWSVAHTGACDAPISVLGNYFQKCFFANAYPEPVLRYCSNSNAASLELNAK